MNIAKLILNITTDMIIYTGIILTSLMIAGMFLPNSETTMFELEPKPMAIEKE